MVFAGLNMDFDTKGVDNILQKIFWKTSQTFLPWKDKNFEIRFPGRISSPLKAKYLSQSDLNPCPRQAGPDSESLCPLRAGGTSLSLRNLQYPIGPAGPVSTESHKSIVSSSLMSLQRQTEITHAGATGCTRSTSVSILQLDIKEQVWIIDSKCAVMPPVARLTPLPPRGEKASLDQLQDQQLHMSRGTEGHSG